MGEPEFDIQKLLHVRIQQAFPPSLLSRVQSAFNITDHSRLGWSCA